MRRFNFKTMVLAFMAVTVAMFNACNTEDVDYDTPGITVPDSIKLSNTGAAQEFELLTGRAWKITFTDDAAKEWLSVSPDEGFGETSVSVRAIANTGKKRSTILKASSSVSSGFITVVQDAADDYEGGDVIYYEPIGKTAVSANTSIKTFNDEKLWGKTGDASATVTYYEESDANIDIRTSKASSGYAGASGGNALLMRARPHQFIIQNLDISQWTNNKTAAFTFTFGISDTSGENGAYVAVTEAAVELYASLDGTKWTRLSFTNPNTPGWVLAETEFRVPQGSDRLFIKFADAIGADGTTGKIRLDDFSLITGGAGNVTVGKETPVINTEAVTNLLDTSVTLNGSYNNPENGEVKEAGFEWDLGTATGFANKQAVTGTIANNSYSYNLSGLTVNTAYKFRAYAIIDGATYYGSTVNFTTTDPNREYKDVAWVRSQYGNTISGDYYLKATVVSDPDGGNRTSLKSVVVSDDSAGIMIYFTADETEPFYARGTELEVSLDGANIADFGGLVQISNLPNAKAWATGVTNTVTPIMITADELLTGNYESRYVGVRDVQVVEADLSKTYVVGNANTSINMESNTGKEFVMFNSRFAVFKDEVVTQNSGTIYGLGSVNGSTIQICPQNMNDFRDMTGSRFSSALPIEFGSPSFSADLLQVGEVINNGKITIPYSNAAGTESYTVTITTSGAGAPGIIGDGIGSSVTKSLTQGSGNIEFNISGIPTADGQVVFTINGITELTTNTVSATVIPSGATPQYEDGRLASWDFSDVPTMPMAHTGSGDLVTGSTLDLVGWSTPDIKYTAGSFSIYVADWSAEKYWLVTMPLEKRIALGSTIDITFNAWGSNTGPKNFVVEYSKDNSTWVEMEKLVYANTNNLSHEVSYDLTEEINTSHLYIRVKPENNVSINDGTVAAAGTSRMAKLYINLEN